MDVLIDIHEERNSEMDLIGSYPKHLQLPKSIDDNDDAFRLIKQLNTYYANLLSSFADRSLHNIQLEDLPKDIL